MEDMDDNEIEAKEIVLSNIEVLNYIDLVYYLTNCEQIARAWQGYKQKNSQEPYFVIKNIDGSKKIYIVKGENEEETERTKSSYDAAIRRYKILQDDEEVINLLKERISEIEYDNECEDIRAEAVYIISTILRLEVVKQKRRDNNWSEIQEEIVGILHQMTVRDLLTTLEWSGRQTMIETRIFSDELVKRIPEMTEEEFTRYLTNINIEDYFIYNNAKIAISNKIQLMTPSLAQKYLQLVKNRGDILEIIDKAEENNIDRVEVLLETLDSSDYKVQERNQELIAKLSEEQVVRLLLMGSRKYVDEKCDKLLAKRLNNISNVMLEALVMAYNKTGRTIIIKRIYDICEQRGKLKYNETGNSATISIDGVSKAQSRAELFLLSGVSLLTTNTTVNKGYIESATERMQKYGKSYEEATDEVKGQIYEEFEIANQIIDVNEETIRYIKKLQLANDSTLMEIIRITNNIPIKDKVIQTNEEAVGFFGLRTIQAYLNSRIIKTVGNKNMVKLSLIPLEGGILDEAIKERIARFQLEGVKSNSDAGENPGSTDGRE